MINLSLVDENEYNPHYKQYISALGNVDLFEILIASSEELLKITKDLSDEKMTFRYEEGKWTIKELVLHMIDAERIFSYRALRFSRNDKTELAGFEENDYVPMSNANLRTPGSLISEYESVRHSTIELFRNFTDEMLFRTGVANGAEFSVILIGISIAGHELHHLEVLKNRYLITSR